MTPEEWSILALSAKIALWCAGVNLVPAIACGWLLARKEFAGKLVLDSLIHLPLVLPPVVTGYLLLVLFGSNGVLGKWIFSTLGIRLAFTWKAAVLASMVVSFPLAVRSIRTAVEMVDVRLEEASRTLGSNPLKTFLRITLPLSFPGVVSGFVLSFARSIGEFGATITFAGNIPMETRTLPLALYTYLQSPGGDAPALRLVIISVLIAFLALAISEFWVRSFKKRMGVIA
ncbi:MAG: molybdate ABC transporter permease subunit [Verrucomicrobia bacterium]|nr:molybdate ABC transporter permease subunit [Verrucomicrobiota bacterium]